MQKDPETGELVIMGIYPQKPYFELGVISGTTVVCFYNIVEFQLNN